MNLYQTKNLIAMDFSSSAKENPVMVNQNIEELLPLKHFRFQTEEECLLAIGLFLSAPDKAEIRRDFNEIFKFVLRMIKSNSSWAN